MQKTPEGWIKVQLSGVSSRVTGFFFLRRVACGSHE